MCHESRPSGTVGICDWSEIEGRYGEQYAKDGHMSALEGDAYLKPGSNAVLVKSMQAAQKNELVFGLKIVAAYGAGGVRVVTVALAGALVVDGEQRVDLVFLQ